MYAIINKATGNIVRNLTTGQLYKFKNINSAKKRLEDIKYSFGFMDIDITYDRYKDIKYAVCDDETSSVCTHVLGKTRHITKEEVEESVKNSIYWIKKSYNTTDINDFIIEEVK